VQDDQVVAEGRDTGRVRKHEERPVLVEALAVERQSVRDVERVLEHETVMVRIRIDAHERQISEDH